MYTMNIPAPITEKLEYQKLHGHTRRTDTEYHVRAGSSESYRHNSQENEHFQVQRMAACDDRGGGL